ncbi:MAG TPA: hypothetical protein VMT27_03135 [Actinomycetes bacterium]|nr:hypothetical protein [Actinomycetes bacterium]
MSQHHDPVHPDSGHLTAELIADLDEGLLDDPSASHAREHLTHCAECQSLHSALSDVSQLLGSLPTPAMPGDVSQRLADALSQAGAEANAALSPDAIEEPAAAPTVVPLEAAPSRRQSGWAGRGLGVAASVAAVLFLGALVVPSLMNSGNNGDNTSASGATDELGTADASAKPDLAQFAASRTGTNYRTAAIEQQVVQLVAHTSTDSASLVPAATGEPAATPQVSPTDGSSKSYQQALRGAMATDPAAAQACLEQYLDVVGVAPLAIDIGTFQGKPAAVIVLRNLDHTDHADVYVVDPTCTGPDAVMLFYASVPLPASLATVQP